jgi:hypothetical protein
MNFVTSLMGGDWLAIGAAILTLGSLVLAFLTKKSSDAKVAQANQKIAEAQTVAAQAQTQTAETRDVAAQANASAAQAGAQAVKERTDVEADTAAKSDGAAPPAQTPALPPVQAQTRIVDTSCDWVKAIYLAASDVDLISPLLAREIDDHNKAGVQHCGWGK